MARRKPTPPLKTTPWTRRTRDGVYFGHDRSAVAYWELPLVPLKWEDGRERLSQGARLDQLLTDLGDTSVDVANGLSALAAKRNVHIFCGYFERAYTPPQARTEAHAEFLERVLPLLTNDKTLLVGVRLWTNLKRGLARGSGGGAAVTSWLKQTKSSMSGEQDTADAFAAFADDYNDISEIMRRYGATQPRPEALSQLESWFARGSGPDCQVLATPDSLTVPDKGTWQISAVTEFTEARMSAPHSVWLMDAMTDNDPAAVVSIRADLLPPTVLRAQLRQSQRKLRAAEEEEEKTGDISRDEIGERSDLAKELENTVQGQGVAWLSNASILFGRELDPYDDSVSSFADTLRTRYGIETKPMEHRQRAALAEMQPCGAQMNPFDQVLNIPLVAYAGLGSFSNIGDEGYLWLGDVDPDYVPNFLDPRAAPNKNKSPVMGIFGDPGSGKASSVDEPVLAPSGWRRMGDLRVGDDIIGRDGRTHQILGVYPQGVQPLYRVTFSDGAWTEVTGDHLWAVTPSEHPGTPSCWQIRTTDELRESVLDEQGKHQWRIPMVEPVVRPHADLPVDPYLLGVLIGGDALTRPLRFFGAETESASFPAVATTGSDVLMALRELGLYGCTADATFIPRPYLMASVEQRFALLQALMDVAGGISEDSRGVFDTGSERLMRDLTELIESLGGTARMTKGTGESAAAAETRDDAVTYRLTIELPSELGAPFRRSDKTERWTSRPAETPSRSIVEITYVRDGEAQCIAVSAPDRLYVTRSHIVTHNTFAAQLLAGQAALAGVQTIMINPKGFDSLSSFSDWVAECGVPANRVSLTAMEEQAGAFDPFRFADPLMAAEILNRHIVTVLGNDYGGGLSGAQEIELGAGLVRGAEAGARCAFDALQHVEDPYIVDLVLKQAKASSVFRLGFGYTPQPAYENELRGLTLIEFDRKLPFPTPGTRPGRDERIAVGAMRLVTRASLEILMRSGGGVMVVDEAHHYLNSAEGLSSLQSLGREGRSLGLLPIFLTQRVSDLVGADMESYMSRVLVMKLNEEEQARAGLKLAGLEATPERIAFLREAGPRAPSDGVPARPSVGFLRDIDDRHAVISIGPGLPEDIRLAFSTNPEDRERRKELLAAMAAADTTRPTDTDDNSTSPSPELVPDASLDALPGSTTGTPFGSTP